MLRYNKVKADIFTDTYFTSDESLQGNKYAQLLVFDFNFIFDFPVKSKSDLDLAIKLFFKWIGVPPNIICNGDSE